jgi:hypothetical protein
VGWEIKDELARIRNEVAGANQVCSAYGSEDYRHPKKGWDYIHNSNFGR